jgi:hypothetical protein
MREMVSRRVGAVILPDSFVMPPIADARLAMEINSIIKPHPDLSKAQIWSGDIRVAAAKALTELEPMMMLPSESIVTAWLWPIGDAVEYTPAEDEFFRRAHVLWMASDLPHVAWTLAAQREGIRTWRRLPSVAAVLELVGGPVLPLIARHKALRHIACGVEKYLEY